MHFLEQCGDFQFVNSCIIQFISCYNAALSEFKKREPWVDKSMPHLYARKSFIREKKEDVVTKL